MPYQESTPPPLQILIGLGFTMVTSAVLEKRLAAFMHPSSFEIIETGTTKELTDYTLCGIDMLRILHHLSDGYAKSELGRPVYCILVNQAYYTPENSTSFSTSRRIIIEVISVIEGNRPVCAAACITPTYLQRSLYDPTYRGTTKNEAVEQIVRFVSGHIQTMQKRLTIFKRE